MFFGGALFWPSCQKREILETHQKKKKILTDNWKALFLVLWCFFCFSSFVFFFCLFFCFGFFFFLVFCFFGGFKGQVRWPEGPPHLALNPPYFFSVSFFCFFSFCFVFLFWRFKDQVRWPKGPPHLALNPPNLFFFLFFLVCCCSFPFFALSYTKKNLVFPPKKGSFVYFLCFSFFLPLPFFGLPLFQFFFLCLSLLLVPFSFPSCLFFCFLLLPCFCLFLSFSFFSAFVSWKEQHQKDWCTKFFFINLFFFLVSCLLFSLKSLFLLFVLFADLKLCFCSTSLFLVSKKTKLKNTNVWSKGELEQNGFFMNLCFAKCKKLSFFGGHFWADFGGCAKNTIKIGISALFEKAKNGKKGHFQSQ